MPLNQTPEPFTPDEFAYYTAQRTSSCPREPPTSNSSTRANQGTDERRTLAFDSSAEEESVPRRRSSSKNRRSDAKASPTQHSPRSSTRSSHHKRRSSSSRSGERSTSRSASRSRFTRETRIHVSNSEVTSLTYSSSSEGEETVQAEAFAETPQVRWPVIFRDVLGPIHELRRTQHVE